MPEKFSAATEPGQPSLLRELNARRLLAVIREDGPLSRPELARRLDLSAVTVASIAKSLVASGVLSEVGTRGQGLGRRPVVLDVVPTAAVTFVADVRSNEVAWRSADLRGQTLDAGAFPLPDDAEALLADIEAVTTPTFPAGSATEMVIAVPATVAEDGVVRYFGKPGILNGVPLGQRLSERLGTQQVSVLNDINLAAIGEHEEGAAHDWSRFAFIGIRRTGIGMGLILDGRLYSGTNGRAGEIGNLRLGGGREPFDTQFVQISPAALDELAKVLAVTFAVLDLDGVVVYSEIGQGSDWLTTLEGQLEGLVPFPIRTVPSRLGADAVLRGATLVGLERAWQRLGTQTNSIHEERPRAIQAQAD